MGRGGGGDPPSPHLRAGGKIAGWAGWGDPRACCKEDRRGGGSGPPFKTSGGGVGTPIPTYQGLYRENFFTAEKILGVVPKRPKNALKSAFGTKILVDWRGPKIFGTHTFTKTSKNGVFGGEQK